LGRAGDLIRARVRQRSAVVTVAADLFGPDLTGDL